MANSRSHLLSIALTPTTAQIAEVRRSGSGVQVLRQSTLTFAEEAGLDNPTALGAALGEHLKSQGYTTRYAVIGLCPRWVLARHRLVPPADADAMRGIVNLHIEREFSASAADMSFDYLLGSTPTADQQVPLLLTGVRRSVLQQAQQAAQSAGLKIEALTPTTLAAAPGHTGTLVLVEHDVAGVMRVNEGVVTGLASCTVQSAALGGAAARSRFLADLSRCMLQLPGNDRDAGLTILLPASVAQASAQALTDEAAERFGSVQCQACDPAQRLAEHATDPDAPLIDFNASRLAPPKRSRLTSNQQWLIRAAVIVLLLGGTACYLWFDATARRDALQAEYDAIKDKAEKLSVILAQARLAEPWFDKRPPTLDCMLELTRTFPTRGEIRVETLTLQDDMTGQIDCTAEDRQTMDAYFQGMQRSSALLNVDRGSVRPGGAPENWIDFPVSFRFEPKASKDQP